MSYEIEIRNSAKKDLKKLKQSHLEHSFEKIINTLYENPYEKVQSFEKLLPKNEGKYSRRINSQHRVVYSVDESRQLVTIYSAWTHYE